jgi:hypothetical protein
MVKNDEFDQDGLKGKAMREAREEHYKKRLIHNIEKLETAIKEMR